MNIKLIKLQIIIEYIRVNKYQKIKHRNKRSSRVDKSKKVNKAYRIRRIDKIVKNRKISRIIRKKSVDITNLSSTIKKTRKKQK